MINRNTLFRLMAVSLLLLSFATASAAQRRRKQKEPKDAIGHQPMALENTFQLCKDGLDNDSDGYVDCDDQDCLLFAICADAAEGTADAAEANVSAGATESSAAAEEEEVVDLDSLEEEPEAPAGGEAGDGSAGHGHGGGALKPPKLKLFFDLLVEYEFERKIFQFTRDHAHVMLELSAMDWLSFRADIAFEPEFYEAVFHIKSAAEFRIGKVLVPFGQNEFHHLIGGRVDKDELFLPTVWGDYGFAFKHFLYDGDVVAFDYSLWVINGFQAEGDIKAGIYNGGLRAGTSDGRLTDNNRMKGVGLRPVLHIGPAVTIGTSWYMDMWDEKNDNPLLIYGVDIEFGYDLIRVPVLKNIRLRAEAAWAEIKLEKGRNRFHGIFAGEMNGILPNFGMRRSGYNLELSYRILRWLFLRYREGRLNDDNRLRNAHDLLIHEPGIVATLGPVQLSFMAQIHTQLATKEELLKAEEIMTGVRPDSPPPNESRLLLRMLFRY